MKNPEKIEIEGLKTIHKLCEFGADHNMEGCTFTEIVERMFSKIEQMKTQVNTLDEMLLNQGEVLAQAKSQAVPEGFVIFPKKQTSKMRSLARDFDARLSLTKYEQLHNIWVKQAMLEAQEPTQP